MILNPHFKKFKEEYFFSLIEKKIAEKKKKSPLSALINLGIGDVVLPLAPTIAESIQDAVKEMTSPAQMRGYGPTEGYLFLRKKIAEECYENLNLSPDEVFISEGTNNDTTNVMELFSRGCKIGILDPTYPAYLGAAIIEGRKSSVTPLPCLEENQFAPIPPKNHLDLIYLCSPNNPTGVAMNNIQLKEWVDYAHKEKAVLVLDNAYEAFISSPNVPRSIYEIEGAKEVAIECRSFSKSAGFTGLRCAYMVIPRSIFKGRVHDMWLKRQSIKTNGVSYPIQRGAEASLSVAGKAETGKQIFYYMEQARLLKQALLQHGFSCFGGENSPYIWWKIPNGKGSWDFFDEVLEKSEVISTPGVGFGNHGEGYLRLSSFITEDQTKRALTNLKTIKT